MTALLLLLLSVSSVLRDGDDAFRRFRYTEAIVLYESALTRNSDASGAHWRLARCYITIGDTVPRDRREPYYRDAERHAKLSVETDPLSSDAQTWYAIATGYVAMYEGVRAKVARANDIKRALDRAVELDPRNDVAHSVLGTFYRTLGKVGWMERQLADLLLGGLPPGGFADAERSLLKAVELAPDIIRHRFELGQLYVDMERPDDAKRVFTEALRYPPVLASDHGRIERMKRRLAAPR
ncbi:MAG: tetratricopeptide repeat protein [Bacteroidetes bacterium]|nr:MAG: tetratricopeptide repeat protein [Bacteroidota bacterium]